MVFKIVVPGAELGTTLLYVMAQSEAFAASLPFQIFTFLLVSILAFKMFVNVHQWFGAIERLEAHDLAQ